MFATINSSQKPVDRSLTYELFGYNVDDEPESLWTPDKLAVFLTRKLGTDATSALNGKIIVAPKRDEALQALAGQAGWKVSTAVVVHGILRLISSNPKRDANAMRTPAAQPRTVLKEGPRDKSPMREVFIAGNDTLIYTMVANYTTACQNMFWDRARSGSYILKTVGVQALFDILRKLAHASVQAKDFRVRPADTCRSKATADIQFPHWPQGQPELYVIGCRAGDSAQRIEFSNLCPLGTRPNTSLGHDANGERRKHSRDQVALPKREVLACDGFLCSVSAALHAIPARGGILFKLRTNYLGRRFAAACGIL